jgi:hypothetical protein
MPYVLSKLSSRAKSGIRKYLVIGIVTIVIAVCVTATWDSRTDTEKLQGKWILREMNGWFEFYLGATKGGPGSIAFDGEQGRFSYDNGCLVGKEFLGDNRTPPVHAVFGTFSCDTTRSPKQITFVFNDRKVVGIYSVSSNTLWITAGKEDETPPSSFGGGPESRPALLIFGRAPG